MHADLNTGLLILGFALTMIHHRWRVSRIIARLDATIALAEKKVSL